MQSKCKHCKQCEKITVNRTDRKGNEVEYTFCKQQEDVHELSNWLFIAGGYLRSTNYIDGKLQYFHYFFKDDKCKEIDHIDGDKTNNCLDNLYECNRVQNTQNRHDKNKSFFHNVRKNDNDTYTAFKFQNGKYINIGVYDTDLEAYDSFIKYSRIHQIPINPNTLCYNTYSDLRNTNSIYNIGATITGSVYNGQNL